MEEKRELAIEVENLNVKFIMEAETVEAVNDLSFTLEKGTTLGLVGETGAGKTTTALSLLKLIPNPGHVTADKLKVCGKDVMELNAGELSKFRGTDIAMIFQDPMTSLNPVFPVGEQIAAGIKLHNDVTQEEAMKRAEDLLELVGIPRSRAVEYPHQLSGGMKQRIVIAIALACNPKVLIADEPTTALDVTIQAQILHLIKNLKREKQLSMLMITHDLGIVADTCDNVAVIYAGQIVEIGTLREVFNHTRHPYTEGLFNSLPNINQRTDRLKPIPGLMPDPSNLPIGCPFAPRCSYATEECTKRKPSVHMFSDTHKVLCTAYDNEGFKINRKDKE
ncbi:MAG: ABC transporter ATP-binding protein [Sphaerochaetaceae bacterium]|nr:ABC transporter ATP-binding protein [Sphaerochaetaceae bacterium]